MPGESLARELISLSRASEQMDDSALADWKANTECALGPQPLPLHAVTHSRHESVSTTSYGFCIQSTESCTNNYVKCFVCKVSVLVSALYANHGMGEDGP